MAEVIQCPHCLLWLNFEKKEAVLHYEVLHGTFGDTLLYKCQKCGAIFSEYGSVIAVREDGW